MLDQTDANHAQKTYLWVKLELDNRSDWRGDLVGEILQRAVCVRNRHNLDNQLAGLSRHWGCAASLHRLATRRAGRCSECWRSLTAAAAPTAPTIATAAAAGAAIAATTITAAAILRDCRRREKGGDEKSLQRHVWRDFVRESEVSIMFDIGDGRLGWYETTSDRRKNRKLQCVKQQKRNEQDRY